MVRCRYTVWYSTLPTVPYCTKQCTAGVCSLVYGRCTACRCTTGEQGRLYSSRRDTQQRYSNGPAHWSITSATAVVCPWSSCSLRRRTATGSIWYLININPPGLYSGQVSVRQVCIYYSGLVLRTYGTTYLITYVIMYRDGCLVGPQNGAPARRPVPIMEQ